MIILAEYQLKLNQLKKDIDELGNTLKLKDLRSRMNDLEEKASVADFWEDMDNSQKILVEQKQLKEKITQYEKLYKNVDDCQTLIELAVEENDNSFDDDIINDVVKI